MYTFVIEDRMEKLNEMKVFSFDAETNGLWRQAFSITFKHFVSQ